MTLEMTSCMKYLGVVQANVSMLFLFRIGRQEKGFEIERISGFSDSPGQVDDVDSGARTSLDADGLPKDTDFNPDEGENSKVTKAAVKKGTNAASAVAAATAASAVKKERKTSAIALAQV